MNFFFKSVAAIVMLVFSIFTSYAQSSVSGHVFLESKDEPLPCATVRSVGSKQSTITDVDGAFHLPVAAHDTLVVSYLGCKETRMPLDNAESPLDVVLHADAAQIDTVVVTAHRRPVQISADGLTVNMDAIRKDGKQLTDVLAQVPTLKLQGNDLQMAGRNGVVVMVNGHVVRLKGSELMAYLNSIGLSKIRRVQVMATPPVRYEAEGNVGMVNIETDRHLLPGWQGRVLGKLSQGHYLTEGASAKALYSGRHFSIENTVLGSNANSYTLNRYTNSYGTQNVYTNAPKKETERVVEWLGNAYYMIGDNDELSATWQAPIYYRDHTRDIDNTTQYFTESNAVADSLMTSLGGDRTKRYLTSAEANYHHMFGESSDLNITLGYIDNYQSDSRSWHSHAEGDGNVPDADYYSTGRQQYDILTAKADLTNKLLGWNLAEGYKLVYTHTSSRNEESQDLVGSGQNADHFVYREWTNAWYVNASRAFGPVSLGLGIRAELTHTKGISYAMDETDNNHYLKFFPKITVDYAIGENDELSLDVSRRVKRPNYSLLNPFRWYTRNYVYSVGAPFLKPAYIYNASATYMHGNDIFAKIFYTRTTGDFSNMVSVSPDDMRYQVERAGNYLDIGQAGLDLECTLYGGSWLECTLSALPAYSHYTAHDQQFPDVRGWGCDLSVDSRFYLGSCVSVSLLLDDALPGYYYYRKTNNSLGVNAGLTYTNKRKDFSIILSAEDVLRTSSAKYHYYSNGVRQSYDNYYDSQCVSLTIIKKFGNLFNRAKGQFQSSNDDERKRL